MTIWKSIHFWGKGETLLENIFLVDITKKGRNKNK